MEVGVRPETALGDETTDETTKEPGTLFTGESRVVDIGVYGSRDAPSVDGAGRGGSFCRHTRGAARSAELHESEMHR